MVAAVIANVLTDASDWLADFSANWYFLAIIVGVAFFDSVIPIVPNETMVIIGGVAAGRENH
jgi:membrane protein DedA with SNARE-associated domain